jgi:hypothetical protein
LEVKAQELYDIIEKDYEIHNLDMLEGTADGDIAAYERLFQRPTKI